MGSSSRALTYSVTSVSKASQLSPRDAMCRREVPADYLLNPELLEKLDLNTVTEKGFDDDDGEVWQWMYEGRNGWWLYDERTSVEVEKCFKRGDQNCELLIAGFLYIIDFEHMLQYRRNDPSRRRGSSETWHQLLRKVLL